MENKIKEKIIPFLLILLGLFLFFESFKSFLYSIELYKTFRIHRDFNGCIYVGKQALPFYEFIISILGFLFGAILIKRFNILFKILIIFSLTITIQHILNLLFIKVYYLFLDIKIIQDLKLFEFGGILFFTLLLSEYYKYNWKKEIKKLWYLKITFFVLVLFGIKLLFLNF